MKVTLDSNCIYALRENTAQTVFVQELIDLQKQGKITLQIPLIATYENRRGQTKGALPVGKENLEEEFRDEVKALGLDNVVYLPRPALLEDPQLFPSPDLFPIGNDVVVKYKEIADLIHPGLDAEKMLEEDQKTNPTASFSPRWNNRYRDVLMLICHIMCKGDVFVSNDKKIYNKAGELKRLGAGVVISCRDDDRKILYALLQ
jgi:hypothetical protein